MIVKSPFLDILMKNKKFKAYIKEPMLTMRYTSSQVDHDLYGRPKMPKKKKLRWLKHDPAASISDVHVEGAGIKEDAYNAHQNSIANQVTIDQLFNLTDTLDSLCRALRNTIRLLQRNRL